MTALPLDDETVRLLEGLSLWNICHLAASEAVAAKLLQERGLVKIWWDSCGAPIWQITPAGVIALSEKVRTT